MGRSPQRSGLRGINPSDLRPRQSLWQLSPRPTLAPANRAAAIQPSARRHPKAARLRSAHRVDCYFAAPSVFRCRLCSDLSQVRVVDIDEFLDKKRAAAWGERSLATQCQAMRTFFGYAEPQGWCMVGIRRSIKSPCIPKYEEAPKGPPWKEVRRLLRSTQGEKPSDFRAHSILLVCSIYGLRASDIVHLTLDDIDWRTETLTVRRAKRGRTQQFPLQYEVGETIVQYLQKARPHCSCRNLFVTRSTPHRPPGYSLLIDYRQADEEA